MSRCSCMKYVLVDSLTFPGSRLTTSDLTGLARGYRDEFCGVHVITLGCLSQWLNYRSLPHVWLSR